MSLAQKTHIMIHCLATTKAWGQSKTAEEMMTEVTRWHVVDRGWSAVAYAKICDYTGHAAKGRDMDGDGDVYEETGAGASGWNANTVHIALAGGYGSNEKDQFSQHYTPEQDAWLRSEIDAINRAAGRTLKVIGHNEVAAKACPGFDVQEWLKQPPLMAQAPTQAALPKWLTDIFAILTKEFGK